MAIAYDNSSPGSKGSGGANGTLSITHNGFASVTTNRIAFVFVGWSDHSGGTTTATGVTYDGVSMTALGVQLTNGSSKARGFFLINPNTGSKSIVISYNATVNDPICGIVATYTGADQTTGYHNYTTATGSSTSPTVTVTSSASELVIAGVSGDEGSGTLTFTVGGGATQRNTVTTLQNGDRETLSAGEIAGGASVSIPWTASPSTAWIEYGVSIQAAATGIAFDAVANSGDQAASGNYTFSRTVTGSNTFLAVDVELLTVTGATVTSVTDDDGGGNVALTFIGARSTVTGAGRVECWGLANPTTGTKTIRVILSGSIESVATSVSYTGVHQTSPFEGFNSNQATNAGSATDASVVITSVADNCWIHAACVANDTSIAANQTTRNNVAGTLGSGANEDNNAVVTPPGNTTMSYTGMGITTTWAIAGYAIRPIAASNLGIGSNSLMLLGVGT